MNKLKSFEDFINESRKQKLDESNNPEGDAKVLSFMKRLAKEWDIPMEDAAMFVKQSIKRQGY